MALYMLRGRANGWWLPAVAKPATEVKLTEVAAGLEFGDAVTSMSGFEPQSSKINVPIMKQRAEAQIEGVETFQDAVLNIAEDDGTGTDAQALQRQDVIDTVDEGAQGYVLLSRTKQTLAVGDDAYLMAATVGSQVPNWNLDAAAAITAININPSTNLRKVKVVA